MPLCPGCALSGMRPGRMPVYHLGLPSPKPAAAIRRPIPRDRLTSGAQGCRIFLGACRADVPMSARPARIPRSSFPGTCSCSMSSCTAGPSDFPRRGVAALSEMRPGRTLRLARTSGARPLGPAAATCRTVPRERPTFPGNMLKLFPGFAQGVGSTSPSQPGYLGLPFPGPACDTSGRAGVD